jgi:hypothetical protein
MEALPDWLSMPDPTKSTRPTPVTQYEIAFPRILELLCSGSTLKKALDEYHYPIDPGAFMRWIRSNNDRRSMYKEAEEVRSEAWADLALTHATGVDSLDDVSRSKLVVDTIFKLIGAQNRKKYGDVKQVEVNHNVSMSKALEDANRRIIDITPASPLLTDDSDAETDL